MKVKLFLILFLSVANKNVERKNILPIIASNFLVSDKKILSGIIL